MAQYGEDKNQKQELAEARAEIERLRQKLGQQNDDQAAERGRWLIERSNQKGSSLGISAAKTLVFLLLPLSFFIALFFPLAWLFVVVLLLVLLVLK
uniref:hypothetical protein n=1 Tax=Synechococcus sp. UW106 TaxID=368495 RepID=UPI000E0E6C48|nr:hypothetical protein [Synechococcus sp. UW106]